ncbi:hypothetical protein ATK86_2687 [Nocardia fluminea]|uniref:Uncharacterized protein n=1 Tax=Nocardia fluminea TaxID=134984 RepID=A0A2N3V9P0_9NOCA|nr:hypothetical protein ATK86_2687 [Nocardia fluminea]
MTFAHTVYLGARARLTRLLLEDDGMSTAEYAIGTNIIWGCQASALVGCVQRPAVCELCKRAVVAIGGHSKVADFTYEP